MSTGGRRSCSIAAPFAAASTLYHTAPDFERPADRLRLPSPGGPSVAPPRTRRRAQPWWWRGSRSSNARSSSCTAWDSGWWSRPARRSTCLPSPELPGAEVSLVRVDGAAELAALRAQARPALRGGRRRGPPHRPPRRPSPTVHDEPSRRRAEDAVFAELLRGDLGLVARRLNKPISFRITRYLLCRLPAHPQPGHDPGRRPGGAGGSGPDRLRLGRLDAAGVPAGPPAVGARRLRRRAGARAPAAVGDRRMARHPGRRRAQPGADDRHRDWPVAHARPDVLPDRRHRRRPDARHLQRRRLPRADPPGGRGRGAEGPLVVHQWRQPEGPVRGRRGASAGHHLGRQLDRGKLFALLSAISRRDFFVFAWLVLARSTWDR